MTCGYVCPQCEGRGFLDNGEPCNWCTPDDKPKTPPENVSIEPVSDEEWLRKTHEGKCCADE